MNELMTISDQTWEDLDNNEGASNLVSRVVDEVMAITEDVADAMGIDSDLALLLIIQTALQRGAGTDVS